MLTYFPSLISPTNESRKWKQCYKVWQYSSPAVFADSVFADSLIHEKYSLDKGDYSNGLIKNIYKLKFDNWMCPENNFQNIVYITYFSSKMLVQKTNCCTLVRFLIINSLHELHPFNFRFFKMFFLRSEGGRKLFANFCFCDELWNRTLANTEGELYIKHYSTTTQQVKCNSNPNHNLSVEWFWISKWFQIILFQINPFFK